MITKYNSNIYTTESKSEALAEAELLSKLESDFFSVVLVYEQDGLKFYIERGVQMIRINEELIAEFKNGVKL